MAMEAAPPRQPEQQERQILAGSECRQAGELQRKRHDAEEFRGQRGADRGGHDRRDIGDRIDADDQLEAVESAGQRRVEGGGDRAGGTAADQDADIVAAQPEGARQPRGQAGTDLRIARLQSNRGAKTAGDHRLPGDDEGVGQRHAPAIERVGLDRIDRGAEFPLSQPDHRQPEQDAADRRYQSLHRALQGKHRRKPAAGLNAEQQSMHAQHQLAHGCDEHARHHPDDTGQNDDDDAPRLEQRDRSDEHRAKPAGIDLRLVSGRHRGGSPISKGSEA